MAQHPHQNAIPTATPLWAVLAVTFLGSFSTGVFWNAISFIAKHGYDFSQKRNFVLYVVMGAIYAVTAFGAGGLARRIERWISPRALLMLLMIAQALLCLGPVTFPHEAALWIATCGVSFASAILWPIVESYVTAGRHGPQMRSAIGAFNLVWMPAVALPLLLIAPILEDHAKWAIGGQTGVILLMLIPLAFFGSRPGSHDAEAAQASVPDEYTHLLRCARVLLLMSYIVNSALSPILPYRFEAIREITQVPVAIETPIAATWMIARVFVMVAMWRIAFWHGRWGTLLAAGLLVTGGFAFVVLAKSLGLLAFGLAVFGIGVGLAYYAALYYAMAVGRAGVDASGKHEGLIGVGYTIGPLAGLLGATIGGGAAIVAVIWTLLGIGGIATIPPYRHARRLRKNPEAQRPPAPSPPGRGLG